MNPETLQRLAMQCWVETQPRFGQYMTRYDLKPESQRVFVALYVQVDPPALGSSRRTPAWNIEAARVRVILDADAVEQTRQRAREAAATLLKTWATHLQPQALVTNLEAGNPPRNPLTRALELVLFYRDDLAEGQGAVAHQAAQQAALSIVRLFDEFSSFLVE